MGDGITSHEGEPDYAKALHQHSVYCNVLEKSGLELTILDSDPNHPDGCFVEDTAIITEMCAIITNPGEKTRQGEQNHIQEILSRVRKIECIEPPATVEGGDVLRVGNHFYIGLSSRTNEDGARRLASLLSRYGFTSSPVHVQTALHLKTGVTYVGNKTIVCTDEFAGRKEFRNLSAIIVDSSERYAANCLAINGIVLIPKGSPRLKEKLQALGHKIKEVDMSEFKKMDGGLTCLSLLF